MTWQGGRWGGGGGQTFCKLCSVLTPNKNNNTVFMTVTFFSYFAAIYTINTQNLGIYCFKVSNW